MKRFCVLVLFALGIASSAAAFERGWVLNMSANAGGSLTIPSISDSDLSKMGANKMEGMLGYIGGG